MFLGPNGRGQIWPNLGANLVNSLRSNQAPGTGPLRLFFECRRCRRETATALFRHRGEMVGRRGDGPHGRAVQFNRSRQKPFADRTGAIGALYIMSHNPLLDAFVSSLRQWAKETGRGNAYHLDISKRIRSGLERIFEKRETEHANQSAERRFAKTSKRLGCCSTVQRDSWSENWGTFR